MKKILIALVAAFALTACGSNETPVTQMLDKMEGVLEIYNDVMENPSAMTPELMEEAQAKVEDIQKFAKDNADYVLTDKDRQYIKDFMLDMSEKMNEEVDDEDLAEIDEFKTLGDLADEMDF